MSKDQMETIRIEYRIKLSSERTETFVFDLDANTFDLVSERLPDLPPWTELGYNKCEHCPLDPAEHTHCPMAMQLHAVVDRFHDTQSIDEVELQVISEERTVRQTLAIQRALASILDLVSPTCGCPKTAFLKPLARFHLPLASEEETVFRVTGMYLLAQYFLNRDGAQGAIDFDGLVEIYKDLHIVNKSIARRLTTFTPSDSVKNAITLLDMYSVLVPVLVEDELVEMRPFFEAFLAGRGGPVATSNNLQQAKTFSMELADSPGNEGGTEADVPGWLKRVAAIGLGKPGSSGHIVENAEAAAEEILAHAASPMELEPMEGEEKQETAPKSSGKAVFVLPDD